jgi:hypothetical protein
LAAIGALAAANLPIFAAVGAPAGIGPSGPIVIPFHEPDGRGPMGGVWRPGHRGGLPGRRPIGPIGGVMPTVPVVPLFAATPEIAAQATPTGGPICPPAEQVAFAASLSAGPKVIEVGAHPRWRAHWPVVIYGDPSP